MFSLRYLRNPLSRLIQQGTGAISAPVVKKRSFLAVSATLSCSSLAHSEGAWEDIADEVDVVRRDVQDTAVFAPIGDPKQNFVVTHNNKPINPEQEMLRKRMIFLNGTIDDRLAKMTCIQAKTIPLLLSFFLLVGTTKGVRRCGSLCLLWLRHRLMHWLIAAM